MPLITRRSPMTAFYFPVARHAPVTIALVALCTATATVRAVPNEVKISELAPGVYFRKAQTEPKFTGCNQGWVVFKDYVLVIDANFPGQAAEVIQTIRKHTDKPIRFVFDTHYHGDHADISFDRLFRQIQGPEYSAPENKPLFETARTHAAKDVSSTVATYGPKDWVDEVNRK